MEEDVYCQQLIVHAKIHKIHKTMVSHSDLRFSNIALRDWKDQFVNGPFRTLSRCGQLLVYLPG